MFRRYGDLFLFKATMKYRRAPTENISDCMLTAYLSVSSGAANYRLGTMANSPNLKS